MQQLPPPRQSWWTMGLESTLEWPGLRPYNLFHDSVSAVSDSEGALEHYRPDPTWASLQLPKHLDGQLSASLLGALDDPAEMKLHLDCFMAYVHAKQPVVNPKLLYDQAKLVQEEGLGWDAATCLLLVACAIGGICSHYYPGALEDYSKPSISAQRYLRSREYFDAARKRLGLVMGQTSVTVAQCFFFAAGYYVTAFEPLAAWRSLNTASIICGDVLAREMRLTGISEATADNRLRKLFWSCLKTEREIANELGLKTENLHLSQYKTHPVLIPDSEPYEAGTEEEQGPHRRRSSIDIQGLTPEQHEQSWFYYLTDITLRKLELQIETFFQQQQARQHDLTPETRETFYRHMLATLTDLDKQITDHFAQLPPSISVETGQNGHCDDDLREYLRLRMLMIRHCLSRPALHLVLHNTLEGLSPQLCSEAKRIAGRALLIDGYNIAHGLTTHRHPGTWLGIRYCTSAALELYAAAKSMVPGLSLPPGWETGMAKVKIALRYWGAESRDARVYLQWLERLGAVRSA